MSKLTNIGNVYFLDTSIHEPIVKLDRINDVSITADIEPFSPSEEVLTVGKISFKIEPNYINTLLFTYVPDNFNHPLYMDSYVPILVQARWHKKNRINKKWLKRYGMKEDTVLVRCNIESMTQNNEYDPYNLNVNTEYLFSSSDVQYEFRPDQLRRSLKIMGFLPRKGDHK